ncbi:helix-turn-helix domain-containing protein [Sphingobium sp. ba1]|uniref:helix-turn-helix domain-containing protein n=1 Tax=Sphingobium sp. ba1 TaxID=1522072 RepID=UPI003FD31CFF
MKKHDPKHFTKQVVWLTEAETALRLNLSKKWLQAQRFKGGGIRYAKFGSAVRYSLADIEEYEARCLRPHTSDLGSDAEKGC